MVSQEFYQSAREDLEKLDFIRSAILTFTYDIVPAIKEGDVRNLHKLVMKAEAQLEEDYKYGRTFGRVLPEVIVDRYLPEAQAVIYRAHASIDEAHRTYLAEVQAEPQASYLAEAHEDEAAQEAVEDVINGLLALLCMAFSEIRSQSQLHPTQDLRSLSRH